MNIVYAGQFKNTRGKLSEVFIEVLDDNALGEEFCFSKSRNITGYRVGHVYSIDDPVTKDGDTRSFTFSSTKWLCEYPDSDKVLQWQAEHKAFQIVLQAEAMERRMAKNDSGLQRDLEPLRRAYHYISPQRRTAFEVWVLQQLRRPL